MEVTTAWLLLPIIVPLTLALAAFVVGGNWAARLGIAAAGLVVLAVVAVTCLVWRDGIQSYALGNWPAPLGIGLRADGLACAMLLMSASVGAFVSFYSFGYFGSGQASRFWPPWMLLWSALNALFLSADVFNLYVTLELVTLSSVGLIVVADTPTAIDAALRYLLAALAGSLLYLAGIAVIYGTYGALDITVLSGLVMDGTQLRGALLLIMLGLILKTALFPCHYWLPPAHASAPAPVSALLSGLVVKASFYILLRLWFDLFPAELTRPVAMVPAVLGSIAIVWGSAQALVAERLKMLVAYSTVAQVGYLFLGFGLADVGSEAGFAVWGAGILFGISHALAKSSLFLATGTILRVAGHDRIDDLAAVARRLPVTFFAIGCASVSLMGLPPTGAFIAKWELLKAAATRGRFELVVIILAGGLLAAAYLFRVLSAAFTRPRDDERADYAKTPRVLEYSALGLAVASLLLGLGSWPLMQLLRIGSPWHASVLQGGLP